MKAATVPVTERLGGVRSLSVTVPERKIELCAAELGVATLDPLRFKTSIEIDGVPAYGEDAWSGRKVAIGDAVIRIGGAVPRCVLTARDPVTHERDLDTLRMCPPGGTCCGATSRTTGCSGGTRRRARWACSGSRPVTRAGTRSTFRRD